MSFFCFSGTDFGKLSGVLTKSVKPVTASRLTLGYTLRRSRMGKQKGFSLIELLIVVAIILIIAAIAIPNLLRARIAANESAGASTVRTLNTSEVTYSTTYATNGY